MRKFRGPKQRHVLSAAKWWALGTVAAQAAAIATVSVIDAMRKKRAPQSGRFPHLPPQNAQVGPNSMTIFTYGRELYDAMLADIQNRMTCALQIAQDICGDEPRVEAVRNAEKWQGGAVEIALTFADRAHAAMNIGVSSVYSLFYYGNDYDKALVTTKTSRYADMTADDSIDTLARRHLDWLRAENRALQQYLAERRAAQADLPLTNP